MQSNFIPGRQLVRVEGRAVVYADIMDCLYFNEQLTESVPLWGYYNMGGRFVVEMRGFLAFLPNAKVHVLHITHEFKEFYCAEFFATIYPRPDVVEGVRVIRQRYNAWYSADGTAIQFLPGNAYEFVSYELTFAGGAVEMWLPSRYMPSSEAAFVPYMAQHYNIVVAQTTEANLLNRARTDLPFSNGGYFSPYLAPYQAANFS